MQITEIVKSYDKAIDRNIRGIRLQESQFLLKESRKANKGHAQTESYRRCTYTAAKKGTKRYVMSMPCCENIDKQSFKTHSTWRWRDALQLRMLAPLSVPSTQLTITPVLMGLMPSFGVQRYCMHTVQIHVCRHSHKIKYILKKNTAS